MSSNAAAVSSGSMAAVAVVAASDALEHEGHGLAGRQREIGEHALLAALERDRRGQRQRQLARVKRRAVLADHRLVRLAPVVERRRALHAQAKRAPHAEHATDQAVPLPFGRTRLDRHEVLHLADAVGVEEARDQDVRVREVQLLVVAPPLAIRAGDDASQHRCLRAHDLDRCDAEEAAAVCVEQGGEDARRVEARAAVPVDRAVDGHQRDRVQITDDAVLGDRRVAHARVAGVCARLGHEAPRIVQHQDTGQRRLVPAPPSA